MPGNWGREIGGMLQGIGTAGRSFRRRPWLKRGCADDDDDGDYYMWKTRDRYVQQKRVKAVEAESKLKQVNIPN